MQTRPMAPAEAPASSQVPLYALAQSLRAVGFTATSLDGLYLRFEPMARLGAPSAPATDDVGVLVTWRCRSLALGSVDHVLPMTHQGASALLTACQAAQLRVVDNWHG